MSITSSGATHSSSRRLLLEEGFTLVEVMMAITMLVIAVFGATSLLTGTLNRLADIKSRTVANAVLNQQLEYVRSHRYDNIGLNNLSPSDPLYGSLDSETVTVRSHVQFTVSTDVTFKDDSSDGTGASDSDGNTSDYKAVTVTVRWSSSTAQQQLSLESYFQATGSSASQNSPPQVVILTPGTTTAVTGTARIVAWAYDPEDGNDITIGIEILHSVEPTPTAITQVDNVGPSYAWDWNTLGCNDSTVPYQITVAAYDGRGTRNADIISVYVDNLPPRWDPSADLTGTALSGSEVLLSWQSGTDTAGVSGYNAYRGTWSGTSWVYSRINSSLITTLAANDIGLSSGVTYHYYVEAVDWGGNVSVASNDIAVTTVNGGAGGPDTTPPTVPVATATRTGFYSATVTMNSTDNASANVYYIVQREKYVGSSWVETTQTASGQLFGPEGTTVTFDDAGATALQPGLVKNTVYHYRVRAYDASSNWSDWSAWMQVSKN